MVRTCMFSNECSPFLLTTVTPLRYAGERMPFAGEMLIAGEPAVRGGGARDTEGSRSWPPVVERKYVLVLCRCLRLVSADRLRRPMGLIPRESHTKARLLIATRPGLQPNLDCPCSRAGSLYIFRPFVRSLLPALLRPPPSAPSHLTRLPLQTRLSRRVGARPEAKPAELGGQGPRCKSPESHDCEGTRYAVQFRPLIFRLPQPTANAPGHPAQVIDRLVRGNDTPCRR